MKEIVLATGNVGKLREFRAMLQGYRVVTPKELGLEFDVEETGETFYENALIKARALNALCGKPAIADDSGLCVDALGGAPGVRSARYSGGDDNDNIVKLLGALDGEANRKAYFVSCIVYYDGQNIVRADGRAYGYICDAPRGEHGFGYDPVFMSDDLSKTFAEATDDEKNAVSHRARALVELKCKLGI